MNQQPELRIGDAEREAASSALGEHFASGRLTREEYDERSSAVWSAKTNSDLSPLFLDLPSSQLAHPGPTVGSTSWNSVRGMSTRDQWTVSRQVRRPRTPLLLFVFLAILLVLALPVPPWLLILLGWLWFSGAFGRRCRRTRQG